MSLISKIILPLFTVQIQGRLRHILRLCRKGELFGGGFLREIQTFPILQCSTKNTNIVEPEKRNCKQCEGSVLPLSMSNGPFPELQHLFLQINSVSVVPDIIYFPRKCIYL